MSKPQESSDISDSDEYLKEWAEKLAESVTAEELRELQGMYSRQSRNMKATADDRRFARKRAKVIREMK